MEADQPSDRQRKNFIHNDQQRPQYDIQREPDRRIKGRSRSRSPMGEEDEFEKKRFREGGSSRSPDKYGSQIGSKSFRKVHYNVPMLDGPLINFRQFMELQTDRVDTHKAETHYQYYKKHWEKRQNEIFFKEHVEEAWFKEKYDPFVSDQISAEKQSETSTLAIKFFEDFQAKVFDSLSFEITEERIAEIQSTESNDDVQEAENGVSHQRVFLGENFDITQAPYFGFDPIQRTLFIKTIPKELGKQEIFDVIQKIPGFQSLSLSEPVPNQQFQRYGWITFDSEEQCSYASDRFKNDCLVINKHELSIVRNNQKRMVKVAQKVDLKKSLVDLEHVQKLIAAFDSSKGVVHNPLLLFNINEPFNFLNLDCNDERMLTAKCGSAHLRLRSENSSEEDSEKWELPNWQNKVQELAAQKIADLEASKSQLKGVALFKERLATKIAYKVQKQMKCENGAWPCFYCQKKFKASEFVVKHIDNKHVGEEKYQEELQKIRSATTLELYSADKNKITHQAPLNKDGGSFNNYQNRNRRFQGFQTGGFNGNRDSRDSRDNNNRDNRRLPPRQRGPPFKDLDEPEQSSDMGAGQQSGSSINYLEI